MRFILMISAVLFGCVVPLIQAIASENEAHRYEFSVAVNAPVLRSIVLPAEVLPRGLHSIAAPTDGTVAQVFAHPGQQTGIGVILAEIKADGLDEELLALQAEHGELSRHIRRLDTLLKAGHISEELIERNIKRAADVAARLSVLRERKTKQMISSPAGGSILWSGIEVGQKVKGAEEIFWVGDPEFMWLASQIDERILKDLETGTPVAVINNENPERGIINGDVDFRGYRGPVAERANLFVRIPREGILQDGDQFEVVLALPGEREKIIVPSEAVEAFDAENGLIWVANPVEVEPHKFFVTRRQVRLDGSDLNMSYINAGLIPGDFVILNPDDALEEGSVISAYATSRELAPELATALLQGAEGGCLSGSGGGGCPASGGDASGCGAAGGVFETIAGQNQDPEQMVCLIPSEALLPNAQSIPVLEDAPAQMSAPQS